MYEGKSEVTLFIVDVVNREVHDAAGNDVCLSIKLDAVRRGSEAGMAS